jgi:hypothetical protein
MSHQAHEVELLTMALGTPNGLAIDRLALPVLI